MDEKKVVKNVVSFGDCKFLVSCVCSLRHFELARMCSSFFFIFLSWLATVLRKKNAQETCPHFGRTLLLLPPRHHL